MPAEWSVYCARSHRSFDASAHLFTQGEMGGDEKTTSTYNSSRASKKQRRRTSTSISSSSSSNSSSSSSSSSSRKAASSVGKRKPVKKPVSITATGRGQSKSRARETTRLKTMPQTRVERNKPQKPDAIQAFTKSNFDKYNNNPDKQRDVRHIISFARDGLARTPSLRSKESAIPQKKATSPYTHPMTTSPQRIMLSPARNSIPQKNDDDDDSEDNADDVNNVDNTPQKPFKEWKFEEMSKLVKNRGKVANKLLKDFQEDTGAILPGSSDDNKKYKRGGQVGALRQYVAQLHLWANEKKWVYQARTKVAEEMSDPMYAGGPLPQLKNAHLDQKTLDVLLTLLNNAANDGGLYIGGKLVKPTLETWTRLLGLGKDQVSRYLNFVDLHPNVQLVKTRKQSLREDSEMSKNNRNKRHRTSDAEAPIENNKKQKSN